MYYKYMGMLRADMPSEEEMIELLIFNKEDIEKNKIDFRWIHSREFKFNGDMYDIVTKEETNDQLIVYVINDTKEKKLEDEFKKRVHKNAHEDKQRPSSNIFTFFALSEPISSEEFTSLQTSEIVFSFLSTEFYKSLNSDIPSPPPRLV
jgi:hypothetical protein